MDCPQHPAANARCSLSWNLMESIAISPYPIGSMYGISANISGILMGSMLPYIAAAWIRHGYFYPSKWTSCSSIRSIFIPKYQISNKFVLVIPWHWNFPWKGPSFGPRFPLFPQVSRGQYVCSPSFSIAAVRNMHIEHLGCGRSGYSGDMRIFRRI
jgi:hypothetical protein